MREDDLTITVIGLGFVGLTTALSFAEKGCRVRAYDNDAYKRSALLAGTVPFHEPGLQEALARHAGRNLTICGTMAESMQEAGLVFLCVGTPASDEGEADTASLRGALLETAGLHAAGGYCSFIIKSSVPPGTLRRLANEVLLEQGLAVGRDAGLASNPEFLREGSAWNDCLQPDRIVIVAMDERTARRLQTLYGRFDAPVALVNPETAEFVKYASNALLATLISFANEQAWIAESVGQVDIQAMFRLLHEDRRWSGQPAAMTGYVYPGCGYGGYCLPKDTLALRHTALSHGATPKLLEAVIDVNAAARLRLVDKIAQRLTKVDARIGILGLSFKPGSDDVRGTPAADIIRELFARGYRNIIAYDPLAMPSFERSYRLPIQYADTLEEAVAASDLLVLVTAWDVILQQQELLQNRELIDGRYALAPEENRTAGLLRHAQ
jgi:UDPglucose 6-dehydrogenase